MKKERKKHLKRLSQRRERREESRAKPPMATLSGLLSVTPSGFGFVKTAPSEANAGSDIFIPPQFLNGAMDGDEVLISLLPPRREDVANDRGPAGQVEQILKHGREVLVGEVLAGRLIRPLNKRFPENIELVGMAKGAERGDWVEIKLLRFGDSTDAPKAKIMRRLGKAGEIKGDLDAVCAEYSLEDPYTEAEEAEALALPAREIPREDLRHLFSLTIDPTDAKDFDDALSLAPGPTPDEVSIGVHIADVATWIAPKTSADKAASVRGFSCYLPGRTLPMLPRNLTARISLQAGVDSSAHTVILHVNRKTGKVTGARRCHSTIRVVRRLTYAEVQSYLDTGNAPAEWDETLLREITEFIAVSRAMRTWRAENERFIELVLPEVRILCDEGADKISGLIRKNQREADFLVEECMLAANNAVGAELVEKGIAGIFRIHPEPDPEKVDELQGVLHDSFGLAPGNLYDRDAVNAFLHALPDDPRRPVIMSLFMRSMARAGYGVKPELHYGLGKTRYAHFTSPIRRYADLQVHQQLWNYDLKKRMRSAQSLELASLRLCEQEENSDAAYFAANDRLKLRYLEECFGKDPEHVYEGVVAKIFKNGFQLDIAELGLYGTVLIDDLPGRFDLVDNELRQTRGSRSFRCGDYVGVRLSEIDFARGSAFFRPVIEKTGSENER